MNTLAMRANHLGQDTVNAANAAYAQRVDPNLFYAYHMEQALLALNSKAEKAGYKLLVAHLSDAYQCKTSYLARPDGFQIFIHIPMAIDTDAWHVYRYLPIPIPVDDQSALRIRPRHDVIAVSPDETQFRTMDAATLAGCDKFGETFLCPNDNTFQQVSVTGPVEGSEDRCLLYIFTQQFDKVKEVCRSEIQPITDGMYQLSETTFISTSSKTHAGNVKCADGKHDSFPAGPLVTLNLRPGCTAFTQTHTAATSMDLASEADPKVYEGTGDALALFGLKDLHEFINTTDFDATPIDPPNTLNLEEWTNMKNHRRVQSLLGHTGTIIAVIAAVIGIGVVIFLVIKYCKGCRPQLATPAQPGVQLNIITGGTEAEQRPIIKKKGRNNNSQASAPPAYDLLAYSASSSQ
jgi:hypothetical protein